MFRFLVWTKLWWWWSDHHHVDNEVDDNDDDDELWGETAGWNIFLVGRCVPRSSLKLTRMIIMIKLIKLLKLITKKRVPQTSILDLFKSPEHLFISFWRPHVHIWPFAWVFKLKYCWKDSHALMSVKLIKMITREWSCFWSIMWRIKLPTHIEMEEQQFTSSN